MSPSTFFELAPAAATDAKYVITFLVFSVFPAPDSPLPAIYKRTNDSKNDIDNNNIWFGHNVQIEITTHKSLENQIINWCVDYHLQQIILLLY